jgi:recombination protein RecR
VQRLPEPLKAVVDRLARLPGMGPKSALRAALTLLKEPPESAQSLGRSIIDLKRKLCICSRCAGLADSDPCEICSDPGRHEEELLVVSEWDSLLALEEGGFFRGRYFILGGLLSPLDNVTPGSLEFERLTERLKEGNVREVVLALGTTLEAETTASYIKNFIERKFPGVRLSRLAQGMPLGAEVKFMDRETLKQSLAHRQDV